MKNLLLIGLGPHAKRIYFPLTQQTKEEVRLTAIVELEEKREDIAQYLASKNTIVNTVLIPSEQRTYTTLHPTIEATLDNIVKQAPIHGVIIATEPLTHVMYAKWALRNNLSILMDKPVSTQKNISTNSTAAKKVLQEFQELKALYEEKKDRVVFSLMAQRRFHPAFRLARSLIEDCTTQTNCPVTSIQSFHSDGQWRMPTEIVEQTYHPYMQGYGKCSHSGHHFFDIVPYFLEAGTSKNKYYDNVDIFANFLHPNDFLRQITLADYKRLFGKENFLQHNKYSFQELQKRMTLCGEIDAFSTLAFKKGKKVMTLASINLVHNGFARRDWVTSQGRDLYKGNGRVRHESHIIEQGPFQSLHIHSYQASEVNVNEKSCLYAVGGEHHLELSVFKNTGMIGGKPVEIFSMKDLMQPVLSDASRGHQEDARAQGFFEFIACLNDNNAPRTSDLLSHEAAVTLFSGVYQSAIAQREERNPNINLPITIKKNSLCRDSAPFNSTEEKTCMNSR